MRCLGQEVFRIVQHTDIEGGQSQPIHRQRELIRQILRVDTMPDALSILDHVWVGAAGLFSLLRLFQILTLHISDLRDDNDFFASQFTVLDQFP